MPEWLSLVIGISAGYILTVFYDRLVAQPNIVISKGNASDGNEYRFLHVEVENKLRRGIPRIFKGNRAAQYVKVYIRILEPITESEICKYVGRWSSKAEPLDLVDGTSGVYNHSKAIEADSEILLPGESKNITVAIKKQGNSYFHGFNNESYMYNWEKPEYCIDQKVAFLEVLAYTDKGTRRARFTIQNPSKNVKTFKVG